MEMSASPTDAGSATTGTSAGRLLIRLRLRGRHLVALLVRSTGLPSASTGLPGAMGGDGAPSVTAVSSPEGSVSQSIGPDWQSAVKQIRGTADWITTKAFVGVAALLIGTGPLLVRVSNLTLGPRALAAAWARLQHCSESEWSFAGPPK